MVDEGIDFTRLKELNKRVVKEYDKDYPLLSEICKLYSLKNSDKDEIKVILDKIQDIINDLYENNGVTDTILELQTELNIIRHNLDISDSSEEIKYDDGVFVQ